MEKRKSVMIYRITYRVNAYYSNTTVAFDRAEVRQIIKRLVAEGYDGIRVFDKVIHTNKGFESLDSYYASCGL